jgi:NitT/TauT family transport system substrate-binding protein
MDAQVSRRAFGLGLAAVLAPNFAAAATNLAVGSIGHSIAHFPLYVGEEAGFFQANGVDIGKVTEFSTGSLVGTAVTSGSIDIGSSVITDVFSLAKAGRSVKIITPSVNQYYVDIVASETFLQAAKVSPKSSLAEKIKALRGKNIGITGPGSGTEALVLYLLKQGSIDRTRDVQLINVGANIPAVLAALRTNRVDLVSFAWPLGQQAESEGIGQTFVSPARGDIPAMRDELQGVVFTSQDVLEKKGSAIDGFIRGYAQACSLIAKDAKRSRELITGFYPNLDAKALDLTLDIYRRTAVPSSPMPSRAGFERAVNFHRETGLISESYAYADLVATKAIGDALRNR